VSGDFLLANSGADQADLFVEFSESFPGDSVLFQGENLSRIPVLSCWRPGADRTVLRRGKKRSPVVAERTREWKKGMTD